MRGYAERYFIKEKAGSFLNELNKSFQLKGLARNPQMLYMMMKIFGKGGCLPEKRALLYQGFIDYIYQYNQQVRNVKFKHEKCEIEDFLSETGFEFQCRNVVNAEEKAISNLKKMKEDCQGLGLLAFLTEGVKFHPHQTFQEYFAAMRLKGYFRAMKTCVSSATLAQERQHH